MNTSRIIKKINDYLTDAPEWISPVLGLGILFLVIVTAPLWLVIFIGWVIYDCAVAFTSDDNRYY